MTMTDQTLPDIPSLYGRNDDMELKLYGDGEATSSAPRFNRDLDHERHRELERTSRNLPKKLYQKKERRGRDRHIPHSQESSKDRAQRPYFFTSFTIGTKSRNKLGGGEVEGSVMECDDYVAVEEVPLNSMEVMAGHARTHQEYFDFLSQAPSPPEEHSNTEHWRFINVKMSANEDKIKQISKKINKLKKKLRHYEEKFQKHHGCHQSHSKDITKICSELSRLYKELRDVKDNSDISSPRSSEKYHGRKLKDFVFDRTALSQAVDKAAQDAEKRSKIMQLETIQEHEVMEFKPAVSYSEEVVTPQEISAHAASRPSWENLHSLSLSELLDQQNTAKKEKKKLWQCICDMKCTHNLLSGVRESLANSPFLQEVTLENTLSSFKEIKAKLRFLDALIVKKLENVKNGSSP